MAWHPPGISAEEWKALADQHRTEQFLAACRLPGMWRYRAIQHKRGADILYEVAYSANQRNMARRREEPDGSKMLEGEELHDFLDQSLIGEYLLLGGYALECVLKGYLLALIPELVIDDKRLDKLVVTHNLSQLCHECAIVLSAEESSLLKLMSRYIIWGKYTAPLSVDNMPSWITYEDQEEKSLAVTNAFHERRVQSLANNVFARALSLLDRERQRQ